MQTPLKVGVVVPARNEEEQLAKSLGRIPDHLDGVGSLVRIVVDDGSTDATAKIARSINWAGISHPVNRGQGAAVRAGCDAAVDAGCDIVVTMDADGQHRFEDVTGLVMPIIEEKADLVHGHRPFDAKMPLLYRIGNISLNSIMFLLFGVRITDSQCGFRAFRSSAYAQLRWHANDYGIASEILSPPGACEASARRDPDPDDLPRQIQGHPAQRRSSDIAADAPVEIQAARHRAEGPVPAASPIDRRRNRRTRSEVAAIARTWPRNAAEKSAAGMGKMRQLG